MRSAPVDAQDSCRQHDNSKRWERLLDNLPQELWDFVEFTDVGRVYKMGVSLGLTETMLFAYAKGYRDLWKVEHSTPLAQWIVRNLLGRVRRPGLPMDPRRHREGSLAAHRRHPSPRRLWGLNETIGRLPEPPAHA